MIADQLWVAGVATSLVASAWLTVSMVAAIIYYVRGMTNSAAHLIGTCGTIAIVLSCVATALVVVARLVGGGP